MNLGDDVSLQNHIIIDLAKTLPITTNNTSQDDFTPDYDFVANDCRAVFWGTNTVPFADGSTATGNTNGGTSVPYQAAITLQIQENGKNMFTAEIRISNLVGTGRSQNVFFGKPLTFRKNARYTFITKNYGTPDVVGGQYCFFGDKLPSN